VRMYPHEVKAIGIDVDGYDQLKWDGNDMSQPNGWRVTRGWAIRLLWLACGRELFSKGSPSYYEYRAQEGAQIGKLEGEI